MRQAGLPAALLLAAVPAGACSLTPFGPEAVPTRGVVEGGVIRGPDCPTAITLQLFLKARRPGVDEVLARGVRTLRDGRMELVFACRGTRELEVYLQVGEGRAATRTAPVRVPACG